MRHPSTLVVALVLAVMSCGQPLSPYGDLRGSWSAAALVPGSSFTLTLNQSDGTVTGTGRYAIEAGRSGSLSVSGSVHPPVGDTPAGPTVTLLFSYDFGQTSSFSGRLIDAGHLAGTVAVDSVGGHADSLLLNRL